MEAVEATNDAGALLGADIQRLIIYKLTSESGSSLRAANFHYGSPSLGLPIVPKS